MAKRRDITEKLSFDENPCLTIKGKDIEVNADAPTVLKAMGIFTSEDTGADDITTIYDLIFPEESKKEIGSVKTVFQRPDHHHRGGNHADYRGGSCHGRAVTRTTTYLTTGI